MTTSEINKVRKAMLSASDWTKFCITWRLRSDVEQYSFYKFPDEQYAHFLELCKQGDYAHPISYLHDTMLPALKRADKRIYDHAMMSIQVTMTCRYERLILHKKDIDEALAREELLLPLMKKLNKEIREYGGSSEIEDLFYILKQLAQMDENKRPFGLKYAVFHLIAQIVTKRDKSYLHGAVLDNIAYLVEKYHFLDPDEPRDLILATFDIHKKDFIDEWKEFKIIHSNPVQTVLDNYMHSRITEMQQARKANETEGPFKHLPAITKHPAVYPSHEKSYCASRIVRPRIYEVTLPLDDGLYFIVYFHFLEQKGYTQATCYWGSIFDFMMKSVQPEYPGSSCMTLTRSFVKKYPHIACVYGFQDDNKDGRWPYLTTIGWDHQPKEWWLSMRLYDFDYVKLCSLGPLFSDDVVNALGNLRDAALAMMRDIQRSDAKQPKLLMNELFGM